MRLLVIGDLNSHVSLAIRIARDKGADVVSVNSIDRALSHLRMHGADLILMDAKLTIDKLVSALTQERILVLVMSYGTTHDPVLAARSIRAGARDYLPFPPDPELIGAILATISESRMSVIARDPAMLAILTKAEKIAQSDASVLITGESGTGKEVISRLIHDKSRRAGKPFVSLNCAAIPEHLLESELFGHEKGAFTGAIARRIGKFEEAEGGTLLLDEISEMSIALQAKLLRSIQEKAIVRVGSNKVIPVNIRILATSNRNMQEAIQQHSFREDLYFRLNVVSIHIPALRDRRGDLIPLIEHFNEKYSSLNGIEKKVLTRNSMDRVMHYKWPGNVRELDNIIHRSVLLSSGHELDIEITESPSAPVSALHDDVTQKASSVAHSYMRQFVGKTIDDVEHDLILSTLESCHGNRTHAARILGISIRTLRNKLNHYIDTGRIDHGHALPT